MKKETGWFSYDGDANMLNGVLFPLFVKLKKSLSTDLQLSKKK